MASKEIITMKGNFRSRLASKVNYNQRCNFTTNPNPNISGRTQGTKIRIRTQTLKAGKITHSECWTFCHPNAAEDCEREQAYAQPWRLPSNFSLL